ncbi:MAG: hypothetical protein AAGI14_09365 [Pseudomonadota bacterium]
MSDPVLPSVADEMPIDAEFEPAPKRKKPSPKRRGPGWMSLFLVGALSLAALGMSLLSSGLFGSSDDSVELAAQVERLKADLDLANEERSELSASLQAIEGRVSESATLSEADRQRVTDLTDTLVVLESDLLEYVAGNTAQDQPQASANAVQSLQRRLRALERRLAADPEGSIANEDDAVPNPIEPFDPSEIETDIAGLQADIDRLRDEVTTLRGDLSSLIEANDEAAVREAETVSTASTAIALSAIETAARRGQPFQRSFQTLQEAAPEAPGLDALGPLAATGAPTLSDLRDAFRPLKRAALKQEADDQGGAQSILNTLFGDGVRVRREGEINAADTLDTAETALVTGDLEAALEAIDSLPQNLQAVFTDWRQDAQNRLTLEDSLDRLRLAMIAKDRP